MRLADAMSHPPRVVVDTTPASDCVYLMTRLRIRHLPVVDASGRCTGILSDHELRSRGMWADQPEHEGTAAQLKRSVDVILPPGVELTVALEQLGRSAQDAVVVAEADHVPLGVFTAQDAMRLAATHLPEEPLAHVPAPLPLVDAGTTALDARSWLARKRLLHALVVRDERLVGVLSFRDVAVADDLADHFTVADVASRPVVTRTPLSARATAALFARRRIGCLPRVDDDWRPVDLTTRRELMRALAASLA